MDSDYNMEKFLAQNEDIKRAIEESGIDIREALKSNDLIKQAFDEHVTSAIEEYKNAIENPQSAIPSRTSIINRLPEAERNISDQELVEEFILSNRELKDSFVEAKRLDESLTPQEFLKQAGITVVRQLKKHEINTQRKSLINNFMLSNNKIRQAFVQAKKKDSKLTEEDFLKADQGALDSYHTFVKQQETDKVVDQFLKQNRDIEDDFLNYQDDTGQTDFNAYLKVADPSIQAAFTKYADSQERLKDLHKVLDQNPELKKQFLNAKSLNRNLTDIELMQKDGALREAFNKAFTKNISFENSLQSFLMDTPEFRKKYEEFKRMNVTCGVQDFLDYNPDVAAQFSIYNRKEDNLKSNFNELIGSDSAIKREFQAFINKSLKSPETISKLIHGNNSMKERYEDFLKNNESSKVNFEAFVKQDRNMAKLYAHQKQKYPNLTFKQFVEGNKSIGEAYKLFLKQNMEKDAKLVEGYLAQNPNVKEQLDTALAMDATLLFKDFLQNNQKAQEEYRVLQKKSKLQNKKSLMSEFLKSDTDSHTQFKGFIASKDLSLNKNIFRGFINDDVVRKQKFLEYVKNDPQTRKAYKEHVKKNPHTTFDEYLRTHMFENTILNKKFISAEKGLVDEFTQFLKDDDCVVREFVNQSKEVNSSFNHFINNNQRAKLNYEMYITQNPQCQMTLPEFLAANPEILDDEPLDDVYSVFLSENPGFKESFFKMLEENPDNSMTAKEFIQSNPQIKNLFQKFANDEVVEEVQNIGEFSEITANLKDLIPQYIEQNEASALEIICRDPKLKKIIESARMKNPKASLSKIMSQNPIFKEQCIEKIKADKSSVRKIIGSNSDLKDEYVRFVHDKKLQEADFENFVSSNPQVQQIFAKMKAENPKVTLEMFIKEAKKNTDIKDLYIRETLYNPDNNITYHQFLENDDEMKKQFEDFKKDKNNAGVTFNKFLETKKNDLAIINRYNSVVSQDPSRKNFIRDFIGENMEVKNKFNQFVKEKSEQESTFFKFVEGNQAIKLNFHEYQLKNPKGTHKDFVNSNPMVKARFINFVKDHPETMEAFVKEDQAISSQYRDYHVKAQDNAHFEHFLKNSEDISYEFEKFKTQNPKSKQTKDEFIKEFKNGEKARKMFESHQKNNTAEALSIAIKKKEQRGNGSPIVKARFDFKDNMFQYSKDRDISDGEIKEQERALTHKFNPNLGSADDDNDNNAKSAENAKGNINIPDGDQSSLGSNLISPLTGLRSGDNFSVLINTNEGETQGKPEGNVGAFVAGSKGQGVSDRSRTR